MPTDALREEIERRMREATEIRVRELAGRGIVGRYALAHKFDSLGVIPANAVVSVCEAMIREERERWGHVARCSCGAPGARQCAECGAYHLDDDAPTQIDPRCAPKEAQR